MRLATAASLALATTLTLTACSSSTTPETPDEAMQVACTDFAEWAQDGQDPAKRQQITDQTGEHIAKTDQRLQDAHAGLVRTVDGADDTWQLASDVFASTCMDLGWKP